MAERDERFYEIHNIINHDVAREIVKKKTKFKYRTRTYIVCATGRYFRPYYTPSDSIVVRS